MTDFTMTPTQNWNRVRCRYDGPIPAEAKRQAERYERDWYAHQAEQINVSEDAIRMAVLRNRTHLS